MLLGPLAFVGAGFCTLSDDPVISYANIIFYVLCEIGRFSPGSQVITSVR